MTKRELVKRAIAHESGQVPYFLTFTPEIVSQICDCYGSSDIHRAIGNCVYPVSPVWWDWHDVGEDYGRFDAPSYLPRTRGTGSYEGFAERLAEIKETTGCYVLCEIYGSHFEKAYFARNIENFLADMVINPDFARRLLNTIIRKNLVMIENLISYDDIDGIVLGSDWGSQRSMLMSPDIWREMIAPGELKEYELIKSAGKDVWVHSCGNIEPIIADLVNMGIDVLNPIQPEAMDIYELKRLYGRKMTFWGGISTQLTLPYGTPDEVRRETREVIAAMSSGGGYITSPSQAIQGDVPIENIAALIDEAKAALG